MMKWLRKHTKQIMVVVVLLAMFSFVGGSALVGILAPEQASRPYATAFGHEILLGDRSLAQYQTEVLEYIGIDWSSVGMGLSRDEVLTPDHWYLLREEAAQAGVAASESEINEQYEWLVQRGLSPAVLDRLRQQYRVTPSDIREALGVYIAIIKNGNRVRGAAEPSESQIKHYVRDTEDKISIRHVALNAENFVDPTEAVDEAEVQALFEQYKDVDPETSETGLGYRYPPRVNVQYVCASFPDLQKQVDVSFEDVKSYWKKNKADFTKEIQVDAPQPASQPATTQPVETPKITKRVEMTFSEAREGVERLLRKRNTERVAEQAMRKVSELMNAPWFEEKIDPKTGYKPIPEGVDAPDYLKKICDRVSKEFNLNLKYAETGLMTHAKLRLAPDVSGIKIPGEGTGMDAMLLADLAFRVPPLFEIQKGRETTLSLQLFQPPDSPLNNATGAIRMYGTVMPGREANRLVVFRVVEARPAEPPASVDEVRDQVVQDIRLLRAFDRIEPIAKEFYTVAHRVGLHQALEMFPDLKKDRGVVRVNTPPAFARRARMQGKQLMDAVMEGRETLTAPSVPAVGVSQEFVDGCFEMTAEDWTPPAIEAPVTERTQAATTQPAAVPAPKLRVLPVQKLKTWYIVELTDEIAVDSQKYATTLRDGGRSALMGEQMMRLAHAWYSPSSIEKRCGFTRLQAEEEIPADEGIQADEEAEEPASK